MSTEKCSGCDQMKKENKSMRQALLDTNKNYVEVVNENLSLRRELEAKSRLINQYKVRIYGERETGLNLNGTD